MQLVFLVSIVNGIFEELFVAGYIITALTARRGMWMAINVSVVVRLLYHLYQGPIGVLTIVPMGLLYGYVYSRTRQLWPLIVAHVLIDIIGLSALAPMREKGSDLRHQATWRACTSRATAPPLAFDQQSPGRAPSRACSWPLPASRSGR